MDWLNNLLNKWFSVCILQIILIIQYHCVISELHNFIISVLWLDLPIQGNR